VAEHAGDSLCAFGQLNDQFAISFNAVGANDDLLEDLLVL